MLSLVTLSGRRWDDTFCYPLCMPLFVIPFVCLCCCSLITYDPKIGSHTSYAGHNMLPTGFFSKLGFSVAVRYVSWNDLSSMRKMYYEFWWDSHRISWWIRDFGRVIREVNTSRFICGQCCLASEETISNVLLDTVRDPAERYKLLPTYSLRVSCCIHNRILINSSP